MDHREYLGHTPAPTDTGPTSTFGCNAFAGNPFEATCLFTLTQAYLALRILASNGLILSQCYAGGNPCEVERPGQPDNAVVYRFPAARTESAATSTSAPPTSSTRSGVR